MLSIELPLYHVENQIFHRAVRQALEGKNSPIAGRMFKLRFVASGSDRFGLLAPVRMFGIGPKKTRNPQSDRAQRMHTRFAATCPCYPGLPHISGWQPAPPDVIAIHPDFPDENV